MLFISNANESSRLDENLTVRSEFYSDHRVNFSTYRYSSPQHLDRSLFAFVLCFFTILNQKEFRIATSVAMFTYDLNAGVVPQMLPPPHDLERLRTTMVDFYSFINKISFHGSRRFIFTGSVYIIMRQLSRAKPGNPASSIKC